MRAPTPGSVAGRTAEAALRRCVAAALLLELDVLDRTGDEARAIVSAVEVVRHRNQSDYGSSV